MNEVLTRLNRAGLARAAEENWIEAYCDMMNSWPQGYLKRRRGLLWYGCAVPHPQFNGVLQTHCDEAELAAAFAAVVRDFAAQGVPFRWWTFPDSRPANLGRWLVDHGLRFEADLPGMAVDLTQLRPPRRSSRGFQVRLVADLEDLASMIRIYTTGFGMPAEAVEALMEIYQSTSLRLQSPWRHYIGWLDGEPVASATVYLGAGVAGLYDVATLPAARGRGIGAQMAFVPMQEALGAGMRAGVLQATEMGRRIYERLGFETVCHFGQYRMDPPRT